MSSMQTGFFLSLFFLSSLLLTLLSQEADYSIWMDGMKILLEGTNAICCPTNLETIKHLQRIGKGHIHAYTQYTHRQIFIHYLILFFFLFFFFPFLFLSFLFFCFHRGGDYPTRARRIYSSCTTTSFEPRFRHLKMNKNNN